MKTNKLYKSVFFTLILSGLTFLSHGQTTTSYSQNDDNKTGNNSVFIGNSTGASNTASNNTFIGYRAGRINTTGKKSIYIGSDAGYSNSTGSSNLFMGYRTGFRNTTGGGNIFIGQTSGFNNKTGASNLFIGNSSGYRNTTGKYNVFTGSTAGYSNTTAIYNTYNGYRAGNKGTGSHNTYFGANAGYSNATGTRNTYIGSHAGWKSQGEYNVFIGYGAGANEAGSNKLIIANATNGAPLIGGDFATPNVTINGSFTLNDGSQQAGYVLTTDSQGNATWQESTGGSGGGVDADWQVDGNNMYSEVSGKVGVGTTAFPTVVGGADISAYKLFVTGGIITDEVRVRTDWADYVFEEQYELRSLGEVAQFIELNGHLPNIPSAEEVESQGVEMGEITKLQQEKIEELTLYTIDQQRQIDVQSKQIQELTDLVNKLIQQ